mmetsp:Transcript_41898/g.97572  ORF Transcript_41898/g.97572 Transcript_41898/m.97572 type:complete len:162 (-) Transcript_41898:97-582(-)
MGCALATEANAKVGHVLQEKAGGNKPMIHSLNKVPSTLEFDQASAGSLADLETRDTIETDHEEEEIDTSWQILPLPRMMPPDGRCLRPDRRLHDKHVDNLEKFKRRVESCPQLLTLMVSRRRRLAREHQAKELGSLATKEAAKPTGVVPAARRGERVIVAM